MYYGAYISVAEKKANAEKAIKKIRKTEEIEPLEYLSPKKENAWWAVKWEENILSFTDFSERIARGRAYVKNGFVIDLKINEGNVSALVMGSGKKTYKIFITIDKITSEKEEKITNFIKNNISSLESFLKGDFPEELSEILIGEDYGLFPTPEEIKFKCDCPDSAYMCKHIAAALFGISSKLAQNPLLFFTLRGIKIDELINDTVDEVMDNILKNKNKKTDRIIDNSDALDLFNL